MSSFTRATARGVRAFLIPAAVVGGLCVSWGQWAAADELPDLRADNQLLQRRLDRLCEGTPFGAAEALIGRPQAGLPPLGGSFPRSMLIPGTDISLRLGGEIREVAAFWFSGGIPNSSPQTTSVGATGLAEGIPLNIHVPVAPGTPNAIARARSTAIFAQTPLQSKFNIETRVPTAWGEARTFMQFDFAGSNSFAPGGGRGAQGTDDPLLPRVRYAYATLGGLLFGQSNSNFTDLDASAPTIDFGGNFGEPGFTRISQVRYTQPLAAWKFPGALSVSLESPETDAWTVGQGLIGSDAGLSAGSSVLPAINPTKAPMPDVTGAWYVHHPWGHLDFGAVVRPGLQLKDGAFVDRRYIGYGGHFSGDIKPGWFGWSKDDITFHLVYGNGIGRYLASTSTFAILSNYPAALPASRAEAANVIARTITEWGGSAGYQHFWPGNLRSTISAGINSNNLDLGGANGQICAGATGASSNRTTGSGGCGLDKMLVSAHANLIWNPLTFVDFGIEYVYAHRVVLSNLKGDQHSILNRIRIEF